MRKNLIKKLIATVSLSLAVVLGTSAVAFASWWQKEWFKYGDYHIHHKGWCDSSWCSDDPKEWKACSAWSQGYRNERYGPRVDTWTTAELLEPDYGQGEDKRKKYTASRRSYDGGTSHASVERHERGIKEYTGYTHWDIV